MDAERFDALLRALSARPSRRIALRLLASSALGGLVALNVAAADAGKKDKRAKKRKKRRKGKAGAPAELTPPTFNAFGCVDVGNACTNSEQCCSGICQGTCQGHDSGVLFEGSGSCPVTTDTCGSAACRTTTGNSGECHMTTGNAAYCLSDESNGNCFPCAKDADCQPFCGPRAACIRCTSGFCGPLSTMCAGTDQCTFPP